MRQAAAAAILLLPILDLLWNLTHVNIGLVDFYGLAAFAHGLIENGAWPATPYFPAGYPLLLVPFGLGGSVLLGGYLLSAAGTAIALWALHRLLRVWELSRGLAVCAVILGWLSPVLRVTAGSPSVDALYTGLGLWFLAAAVILWKSSFAGRPAAGSDDRLVPPPLQVGLAPVRLPRWAVLGLVVAPPLLVLLRYHAMLLLIPVLVALVWLRPLARRLAGIALALVLATIAFNYYSWQIAYDRPLPSVTAVQVRSGIEFDFHLVYPDAATLFAEYDYLCEYSRNTPILADYPASVVAGHTLLSWSRFLRRPAIALALLAAVLMLSGRRRLPRGVGAVALWTPLYALALSPAYYTPRAAALPVLASIAVLLAIAHAAASPARGSAPNVRGGSSALLVTVTIALLLAGSLVSSRSTVADYRERTRYAALSKALEAYLTERSLSRDEVIVNEARLLPLRENPWCEPYPWLNSGWLGDPAIREAQLAGIKTYYPRRVAGARGPLPSAILLADPPGDPAGRLIAASPHWMKADEIESLTLYLPAPSANGEGSPN